MTFRCAAESAERGDDLAGTASTVRAFLLVENPGPWGVDALRDNRLPPPVKQGLRELAQEAGVRVLLIRRFHRRAPREGFRVFAAHAHPRSPWLESATLDHDHDLLGLDLASLGRGRSAGLEPYDGPLLCVCTHGRHDTCCAERGRPVAQALADSHPDETWECSHIGGDRFAGNLLVLPHGLYYGRIDADSATRVAAATTAGELELAHLRGRSGFAMPVQAAEIAVRRHLGLTAIGALTLTARRRDGDTTYTTFDTPAGPWSAAIRTTPGESHQLTCHATRTNPVPDHEVIALTPG